MMLENKRYVVTLLAALTLGVTLFGYQSRLIYERSPCGIECGPASYQPYVLNSPGCVIPDFNIDHPSVARFKVKKPYKYSCAKHRPLTDSSGLSLIFHKERAKEYGIPEKELVCEYQGIARVEQNEKNFTMSCDKNFRLKKKVVIRHNITSIDEDGILVTCYHKGKKKYQTVHYYLQPRRSKKKVEKFRKEHPTRRQDILSVVVMGIDSVSRGNMRRNMPETFRFLKEEMGALDFQAFNKVADNTNPNIVASFMGLSSKELTATCQPKKTKFDDCPLIWKNFSDAGYITLYGEDTPLSGAFHYNRYGFLREPTDYYNRPYMLVADKYTKHRGVKQGVSGLCLGSKMSISVIYDYAIDVAETFRETPYFGFYWNTGITHDKVDWASATDAPSVEYLKKMKASGVLDNTVLFFISDHGIRFGDIRSTYAGLLEERLPYFFVMFPSWFPERFPTAWKNINTNTKRLVSNFDFHVTLRDILARVFEDTTNSLPALNHGQSLFKEIPLNRTCEDANVPEHYCTCEHSSQVPANDTRLFNSAKFVIAELNRGLAHFGKCAELSLSKVTRGRIGVLRKGVTPKAKHKVTTITVVFVTLPGNGRLEATVREYNGKFEMAGDVSRINRYGTQSHCITDPISQKYCYCKDLLPPVPA